MMVVSDNSPVNILIRLGVVNILRELYGPIYLPPAVLREMRHPNAPQVIRDFANALPTEFIVKAPVHLSPDVLLGAGENEAIALALELRARLIVDDGAARAAAIRLGISVIGLVGVLEEAAHKGFIEDLREVHLRLRKTDFRIASAILDRSLARVSVARANRSGEKP